MNIYKNLMFLHGHFVDPREADAEAAANSVPARAEAAPLAASSRSQAKPKQASPRQAARIWLRLWPSETAKVEMGCDARGCA